LARLETRRDQLSNVIGSSVRIGMLSSRSLQDFGIRRVEGALSKQLHHHLEEFLLSLCHGMNP
jgi:hypothetical protein